MANLFSYVVARDYGFAPNPFFGYCTLATCKPDIRKHAGIGDWVVGIASKKYGRQIKIIYAMLVEEALSYDEYWMDRRFFIKRPNLKGSLKQIYGDNIYHHDEHGIWVQEDSHHSQANGNVNMVNLHHDTRVTRILISQRFIYWGASCPSLPKTLRILHGGRGYKRFADQTVDKFVEWFRRQKIIGRCGEPHEFFKHRPIR